ncbi:MAG TPA: single-stranded-DNA-specific exonuclease RecJ [Dehalococcoidia bacterium]|nr:single-stranded-DNA-specific exonuclease RecJ [Dehalococcoidia bacterium]
MLDRQALAGEYTFELDIAASAYNPPFAGSAASGGSTPAGTFSRPQDGYMGRKRWRLRQTLQRGKLTHSGLPKLVAHVLENRGVGSNAEAQRFMGGKETGFADASLLPGFEGAVALLRQSIQDGRSIAVYGDFDVDGITSTAILTETLRDLGAVAMPYIPHREREGYGLNVRAIDSLADRGVEVLVTCDCGTSSLIEVERARELGIDVIVVDHHLPPAALPPTNALLNPKMAGHAYPFVDYSTAGLAFRLSQGLYGALRRPFPEDRYAELSALGTVADMVPLLDENRELVRRGLAAMAHTTRPGLKALIEVAGLKPKDVTSESIAFQLAPRLNAAGRLADAKLALDLLLTQEEGTAISLAEGIDALNKERQRMTRESQDLARELVEAQAGAPLTLVGHEQFHQGIIGLVASRLVESYGRPAVVYQQGEGESRGSCRSITDYDITSGLRFCGDLFERYGGHRQAGGFTIRNEFLGALESRLLEHAARSLEGIDLTPALDIDAEWPLNELKSQEIRWLGRLQPFGQANPEAMLLSRNVTVVEAKEVGEGRHLRLKLKSGAVVWPAIAFGWQGEIPEAGSRVDVVYSLSADRYGPSEQGGALQLQVVDLATKS